LEHAPVLKREVTLKSFSLNSRKRTKTSMITLQNWILMLLN